MRAGWIQICCSVTALLVSVGCGSSSDDEVTGSNAGAATVDELGGAKATRETADDGSGRSPGESKIHLTYPSIRGGGMSDAELSHLNAAVKTFAEGLVEGGKSDNADCYATLATRDLAAIACVVVAKNGSIGHAAFHFIPATGKSTSLEALFDGNADAIANAVEAPGVSKAQILESAVVNRNGVMVEAAASGIDGYLFATWKDLEDALPSEGALANVSKTPAPPLSGNAAWRWNR